MGRCVLFLIIYPTATGRNKGSDSSLLGFVISYLSASFRTLSGKNRKKKVTPVRREQKNGACDGFVSYVKLEKSERF